MGPHGLLLLLTTSSGRHLPKCFQYKDALGNTRLQCSETVWRNEQFGEFEAQTAPETEDMQDQYGKPTMKMVQEAGNEVTTSKSTFEMFLEGKATSTIEEDETALKTSDEFARKPSKVDQIAIQNMEKNENVIKYIEEGETATQTIEEDEKTMKERNGPVTVVSDRKKKLLMKL